METQRNLKHEARNLMALLSLEEAQGKLGATACMMERLSLKICLTGSAESEYTSDKLQERIDIVNGKLSKKSE